MFALCPRFRTRDLLGAIFSFLAVTSQGQTPLVIGVIGDYGSGSEIEGQVADRVKSWNPSFIITLGDNNYFSGSAATIDQNIGQFYHDYIFPYFGSYGSGASSNRFFPTLGNHDYDTPNAQPYLAYFDLPNNERYYRVRRGPVELFALNSNAQEVDGITSDSVQAQWLQSQLAASTAPWKLVYFHHPPHSSGAYAPGIPELRWPFAAWGASAVLSGHDHLYERFITNEMVYFINGLGGSSMYPITSIQPGSEIRFNADYGAMRLEATQTNLIFQFITRSNVILETFSLRKPGSGPAIAVDPRNQTVLRGRSVTFDVLAIGGVNLRYQWQFNSTNIPGAIGRSLSITNAQFVHEGNYAVIVTNQNGSTPSASARLSILRQPLITQQPTNQTVRDTSNVVFQVQAEGYGLLKYQWLFNGAEIAAATNSTLMITNAQFSDTGDYTVVITDDLGSIQSAVARLKVIVAPIIIQQPLSQSVVVGETVVFTAVVQGTFPMTNAWSSGTRSFGVMALTQEVSFLTITNVQMTNAGPYRVLVRNEANSTAVGSNAVLTVLADNDQDGVPDEWESAKGFNPDDPDDADDDADLDHFSNRREYLAGTDPHDTNSVLRIGTISQIASNRFRLQFTATSNKTYSVEFRDEAPASNWIRLAEFAATTTNRPVEVLDTIAAPSSRQRLYRLVTPRLPVE